MRGLVAVGIVLALEGAAYASPLSAGVSFGAGASRLEGDLEIVDPGWALGFGLAGLVGFDPGEAWAVGLQPGWRRTGSERYQLGIVSMPLVADVRVHQERWRLRASFGLSPQWLTRVTHQSPHAESSRDATDEVRRWNVGVIGAIAAEREQLRGSVKWAFVELRVERGLFTLDAEDDLAVHTQDIGLWLGLRTR